MKDIFMMIIVPLLIIAFGILLWPDQEKEDDNKKEEHDNKKEEHDNKKEEHITFRSYEDLKRAYDDGIISVENYYIELLNMGDKKKNEHD